MCGLVGVLGANFQRNKALFEELLYIDYLRGIHSTGVAFLNEKYVSVVKDAVTPDELSYYKKYKKGMSKTDHIGLLGHNRQATRGEVSEANSHPFMHGKITLIHNGTTSNTNPLPKQFSTDSEAICYAINEWGIEKTWDKMEYCNPGTIVFWDAKERSLNAITNGARPFWFSFLKDKEAIVFASEDWMYKGVCERQKEAIWEDENGNNTFFLKPNHHYCFKYDKKEKKVSFTCNEVKFTKPAYQNTNYQRNYDHIHWPNQGQSGAPFRTDTPTTTTGTSGKPTSTLTVGPLAKLNLEKFKNSIGASARGIGMHDFYDKYNFCVGCDESLLEEYATCYILDEKNAFCKECVEGFIALGVDLNKRVSAH